MKFSGYARKKSSEEDSTGCHARFDPAVVFQTTFQKRSRGIRFPGARVYGPPCSSLAQHTRAARLGLSG